MCGWRRLLAYCATMSRALEHVLGREYSAARILCRSAVTRRAARRTYELGLGWMCRVLPIAVPRSYERVQGSIVPFEKQEKSTQAVLGQAEVLSGL